MRIFKQILIATSFLAFATWVAGALACPFCSVVSQTLSQEIAGNDATVIARLVKLPEEKNLEDPAGLDLDDLNSDTGMAEFEVVEIIRGENAPSPGSIIKVVYFGSDKRKQDFLIGGIIGERIDWSTPLPLPASGVEYIRALGSLSEAGADRLLFFMKYLEDSAPLLAQDAYDEFARAPYDVITDLGDRMDRPKLLGWIEDAEIGPTRRRLYLTMLGVCGQEEDAAILESLILYDYQRIKPGLAALFQISEQLGPIYGVTILDDMIRADVRRKQQCLDALVAAYLKLRGEAGLPLIEKRFLANPDVEYSHVYAAIMALRFHGDDTDVIPKARLLQSMRLLLDNPEIADQVITDLTRWEDWSILDQLVTMFEEADEDAWVRQPVISYLLIAAEQPAEIGQRATAALKSLEKLDPKNVKRMRSRAAFSMLTKPKPKPKQVETPEEKNKLVLEAVTEKITDNPAEKATSKVAANPNVDTEPTAGQNQSEPTPLATTNPPWPSKMVIIGGSLMAGLVLFGIYALLLRGADIRSPKNDS